MKSWASWPQPEIIKLGLKLIQEKKKCEIPVSISVPSSSQSKKFSTPNQSICPLVLPVAPLVTEKI